MKYILLIIQFFILFSCYKDTDNNISNTWANIVSEINVTNTWIKIANETNITNTWTKLIDNDIDKINKDILSWKIDKAEKEALLLYKDNDKNFLLLNMLWNIYHNKWNSKESIKYLEEANKLSNWKDGYVLFNLWVSYSNIDKQKAKKYLEEAKKILPDDKNIDNFLKTFK